MLPYRDATDGRTVGRPVDLASVSQPFGRSAESGLPGFGRLLARGAAASPGGSAPGPSPRRSSGVTGSRPSGRTVSRSRRSPGERGEPLEFPAPSTDLLSLRRRAARRRTRTPLRHLAGRRHRPAPGESDGDACSPTGPGAARPGGGRGQDAPGARPAALADRGRSQPGRHPPATPAGGPVVLDTYRRRGAEPIAVTGRCSASATGATPAGVRPRAQPRPAGTRTGRCRSSRMPPRAGRRRPGR